MSLTINTNMFSLNAQRNLTKAQTPLATAMQRLSSGLRINSAKDDAAGLAIGTRMGTQITGLSVAVRNANDGVSFAQTAEGAMDEMINSLQRMYELATQSSSYNTSTDRNSMNQEVVQLKAELDRIVSQTRYNGEQILNQGGGKQISIQVGAEVNETISVSVANVSPNQLGVYTNYNSSLTASDVASATWMAKDLGGGSLATTASVNGVFAVSSSITTTNNSNAILTQLNKYSSQTNVTVSSYGNALVSSVIVAASVATIGSGYLTINGVQIGGFNAVSAGNTTASAMVAAINSVNSQTGVTAYVVGSDSAGIALANTSGAGISVVYNSAVAGATAITGVPFSTESVSAGQNGKLIFNSGFSTGLSNVTTDVVGTSEALGLSSSATSNGLTQQTVNSLTVTDTGSASVTMIASKNALDTILSEKAKLGATQNRLASTIANLSNVRENIQGARSRIMDADFAAETANLTKAMITQQAGISILAQANQIPQQVLALLGGR